MKKEILRPNRSTPLRKNENQELTISIEKDHPINFFLINGNRFITDEINEKDLIIRPNEHYMLINKSNSSCEIKYSIDVNHHNIVYNPYKYEHTRKTKINQDNFKDTHNIPEGYIDILPKWYSIKFSYATYNLIYIKPEMGISIQFHNKRIEYWEILGGEPIVLSGHTLSYYVQKGKEFKNSVGDYHTIINPNKEAEEYVILKEKWSGDFKEKDITRVFNPNQYND
ncbi:MAG: hypothetical protein GF317_08965 [Candidatus Lokiarchaeota archaeon]|nr:hypothetical protein [Candidatus Lokiarchaeota archaeon]MBD3199842.1 hypothetical protein [Candidatus Lokiarchaeota archaeon]